MNFKAYPKLRALGYSGTETTLNGDIYITPKVDGSNVSIWRLENGETWIAKRTSWIAQCIEDKETCGNMFGPLVEWVYENIQALDLVLNRGEVLFGEMCLNQNRLHYDTKLPFIAFDLAKLAVADNDDYRFEFMDYQAVADRCDAHNVPRMPILYKGSGTDWHVQRLVEFIPEKSWLGGTYEEGIVVKRYDALSKYNEPLFAKIVAEEFREIQKQKPARPLTIGDWIAGTYFNEARLHKAIQRMQEENKWVSDNERKNIGPLIGTVCKDIHDEAEQEIREEAFKRAWKDGCRLISSQIAPMLDELQQT